MRVSATIFGARLLIVTHPDFLSAANALKAHKEMLGISTAVVTTQTISGTGAAATDTQIRSWVADYCNERAVKPKWLLLLGDAEKLPTHYDQNNWYTSSKNAGDIWYGQFMPGASAETVPAIGIGRFPVDTLSQADTMVAKVMAFENCPPAMGNGAPNAMLNFYQRLTFASFFEGSGSTDLRWFAEVTERTRNHALANSFNVRRIYKASLASNPLTWRSGSSVPSDLRKPAFAWDGDKADIITAVNTGTALLYHRDHGGWNGWVDPNFNTSDLGAISVTNNQYPVVFSINCASGLFDNETVDLAPNKVGGGLGPSVGSVYWAEAFVRKADGALAVIGDTCNSSTVDNGHLTIGRFDAIFPGLAPGFGGTQPVRRLGDVLNHGRAYMAAVDAGSTSNLHPSDNGAVVGVEGLRHQLSIHILLGDPTVKLRVSPPWNFSTINLSVLRDTAFINVPRQPCVGCPQNMAPPEMVTAVAIDPANGRVIGRTLINVDGNGSIALGGHVGNFTLRVGSGDGTVNNDGFVNSIDLALVKAAFGGSGQSRADLNIGESFAVQVRGSGFIDNVVGGGFNLSFDPGVLSLTSVSVNTVVWEFISSNGRIDNTLGRLHDVFFNSFRAVLPTGDFSIATRQFSARAIGNSLVQLSESPSFPFSDDLGNVIGVTFQGPNVAVGAVPEPTSLALWALGLLGISALRLRR